MYLARTWASYMVSDSEFNWWISDTLLIVLIFTLSCVYRTNRSKRKPWHTFKETTPLNTWWSTQRTICASKHVRRYNYTWCTRYTRNMGLKMCIAPAWHRIARWRRVLFNSEWASWIADSQNKSTHTHNATWATRTVDSLQALSFAFYLLLSCNDSYNIPAIRKR